MNQPVAWKTDLNVAHVGLSIYQKNGENRYPKSLWLVSIFLLQYVNKPLGQPRFLRTQPYGCFRRFGNQKSWVSPLEITKILDEVGIPLKISGGSSQIRIWCNPFLGESFLGSENGRIWGIPLPSTTIHHISTTADCSNWSPQCLLCPLSYIIVLYFFLGDEETTPTLSYLRWL